MERSEGSGAPASHWPLRSEPGDVMTAKQLVYAYTEARYREDREYAAQEVAAFIERLSADADSRVLIALLGLPSDDLTAPVLAEVEARLAERTPAVVEALLRVVVKSAPPACDNAAAALDQAPVEDVALGLVELLSDENEDSLKRAAAAGLVALGEPARTEIVEALDDPEACDWVTEACGLPYEASADEVMQAIAAMDLETPAVPVARGAESLPLRPATQQPTPVAEELAPSETDDDLAQADEDLVEADEDLAEAEEEDEDEEAAPEAADEGDLQSEFAAYEQRLKAFDDDFRRGPAGTGS